MADTLLISKTHQSKCVEEGPGSSGVPFQDLMKKFVESSKPRCNYTESLKMNPENISRPIETFPDGAKYTGQWNIMGMNGEGTFLTPSGVSYTGGIKDGEFDGEGEYKFEESGSISGTFKNGILHDRILYFDDGLQYTEGGWKYLSTEDRRYSVEYELDLQPASQSFLTPEKPPAYIPPGCYDCGYGIFEPKLEVIFCYGYYGYRIKKLVNVIETKWIEENCRHEPMGPVGPRKDLYEEWSEPLQTLPFLYETAVPIKGQLNLPEDEIDFEKFEDPGWRRTSFGLTSSRLSNLSSCKMKALFYHPPKDKMLAFRDQKEPSQLNFRQHTYSSTGLGEKDEDEDEDEEET